MTLSPGLGGRAVRLDLGLSGESGTLDAVVIEPTGVLRALGWSADRAGPPEARLQIDAASLPPDAVYRTPRPDVRATRPALPLFSGFALEWIRPPAGGRGALALGVDLVARLPAEVLAALDRPAPHYPELLDADGVWSRDDIYASGPPDPFVQPEVLELALGLPAPILDVGCGTGALVAALRRRGVAAFGLELDRPEIAAALDPQARGAVAFYDGGRMPFADEAFESVFATEVLEHVPAFMPLIDEMARIARRGLGLTVPDMSAVPAGAAAGIVPWHLLESTHVNFFTWRSLKATLARRFPDVTLFQIGARPVEGAHMPGSLGALAFKPGGRPLFPQDR